MALYTMVDTPGGCYACRGVVTREAAIAEARGCYEHRLREAQEFLARPLDELRVYVQRGMHTSNVIRELTP